MNLVLRTIERTITESSYTPVRKHEDYSENQELQHNLKVYKILLSIV